MIVEQQKRPHGWIFIILFLCGSSLTVGFEEHNESSVSVTVGQESQTTTITTIVSTATSIITAAVTTTLSAPITTTEAPPPPIVERTLPSNVPCFYAEPDLCESISSGECGKHPVIAKALVCCNISDISRVLSHALSPTKDNNSTYWLYVHIRNGTFNDLDVSHNFWKLLKSLAVTDGRIKKLTNEFTRFSVPTCLNISNNNLTEIYPRAFTNLPQLQVLDISHNNLSRIPNLGVQTNLTVDIRGNTGMLCGSVLESLDRGGLKFVHPGSTSCLMNQTFNWFNSTDTILLTQLERLKQLNNECPSIPGYGNCTCRPEQMAYDFSAKVDEDDDPQIIFTARVDCSGLGLIELPEKLPAKTLLLNVSNNNITSIAQHFHQNPTYCNILRFYADDNQISSMEELEGSDFITTFEQFSLRRNQIDKVPEYLLSNTLDNNPEGRLLYLGGNKVSCDCNSAKNLRIWLLARRENIPDYDLIGCKNFEQKVVGLSELKLCQSPHDWTDYIYYLIAAELLLLTALIMKVTYDYWIFKSAGYLPWPASKMPKLPCDWLCES